MEENKEGKKEKLSYEELENVCHQLSEQSRTLYQRLQDADMNNMFRRLDYLFEVIKNEGVFINRGEHAFFNKCIDEIVALMTIPEMEPEEEPKKEK